MLVVRILTLIFLTVTIFAANLIQLASLVIRPFSKNSFRRINAGIAASWWYLLCLSMEKIYGLQVEMEGDLPKGPVRSALVISNHQSFVDILVVLILARDFKALSCLKWFVKSVLRYTPFMGWGLVFLESIFLERDWNKDQKSIYKTFETIKKSSDPIWLVSYVEGTRMTREKLVASQNYARQIGLKPFNHVLIPRHKGFVANIQGLGNRIEVVYDLTIAYDNPKHSLTQLFTGNLGKARLHMVQFPVDTLPQEPVELKDWLLSQFRKKDELLGLQ